MEKYIAFVSSNYRELYVEDVYRVMALPKNYVIQYRYQFKYIDNTLRQNLDNLKWKESIIYYCYDSVSPGYKGTIKDTSQEKNFIPIRKALIRDFEVNEDTGQINFYLELHEFIQVEDNLDTSSLNSKFKDTNVFEIKVENIKETNWLKKIESVEKYFNKVTFFHLKAIDGKYNINYDCKEKKTNLILTDDSSYVFDFLTYDKTEGRGEIVISTDKAFLNLNDKLEKGTKVNSKKVTLDTRPIDFRRDRTYLELEDSSSKFGIRLSVKLKRRFSRSLLFGFLSFVALFSFQTSDLLNGNDINKSTLLFLLATAVSITFGVAVLHWFYNKK